MYLTLESLRRSSHSYLRIAAIEFKRLFLEVHEFEAPNFNDFTDEADFYRRLADLQIRAEELRS